MDTLHFKICKDRMLNKFNHAVGQGIYELRSQQKYRCEIMIWKLVMCVGAGEVKIMSANEKTREKVWNQKRDEGG